MEPFVHSFTCRGMTQGEAIGTIPQSLRSKEEVEMEDLSPPDHNGPPSHWRASRQSR